MVETRVLARPVAAQCVRFAWCCVTLLALQAGCSSSEAPGPDDAEVAAGSAGRATDGGATSPGGAGTGASSGGGSTSGGAGGIGTLGGAGTTGGNGGGGASNLGGSAGTKTTGGADAAAGAATGGMGGGDAVRGGAGGGVVGGKAGTGGTGGVVTPPGYRLVWSDEFDVDGPPSTANWSYEQGFVRNEEAQWYQADNARVEGGLLVIEGRRERVTNPNYQAGSSDWKRNRQYAEYTSTSLHTRGKRSFQFGRFEMRGRIPTAAGMWPAFWTLGVSGEWPSNGEVDVMEFYNSRVLFNVACGTSTRYTAKWDSVSRPIAELGDPAWASKFHVWAMVWDNTKIDLFLDDLLMNTTNLADMLNPDGQSPFRQEHYLLVNLAIGGMNGGNPGATQFPQRYEVDYVRVFQRE